MTAVSSPSIALRALVTEHRDAIGHIMDRYGATDLRLFGSVARGSAQPNSDLDFMVDLSPHAGNALLRLAGLSEELSDLLGTHVDVVAAELLRSTVSKTALLDAVRI